MLEEKAIDNFIENSCEIIREYDADKDFISKDENVSAYSSEDNENFQTCRLIVKAEGSFDNFGAAEHNEVKGIPVKTFTGQIFNDNTITKIIFPDTLEEIPEKAFYENTNLYYVNTGGAKIIQKRAFYQCRYSLHTIDMPEVTEIAEGAFYCCFGQYNNCLRINAPQLKTIMRTGFRSCNLILVAPQLETIYAHSFDYCTIPEAIFPNLTTIVGKKVTTVSGNSPFSNCMVWALELPLLKEIECNFIINNGNNLQYINMPQFTGKLTQNSE